MGCNRRDEVGGAQDRNFCRAVRRCLINDLRVAGARDEARSRRRNCGCRRSSW